MKKAFLFLLGLIATIGIKAQTSPWAGNEVKEGVFYLYNVESGLWLQNNDSKAGDWSTRAAIGTRGLDFTLAGSEGAFTLGAGFGSASINPDNNYLDTGNNPAWTFTSVTVDGVTNAYNINCGNKVLGVVRYNEAGKQDNLFTQTGDERWYLENPDFNIDMTANNTWQLVTKEERLAKMQADASVDNPQDASWLIPSADFANNDRRWDNMWTRNLVSGNGRAADGNGIQGSKCVESWNSGNSIDFYVSINVPNGTYKLSVQGYYRDGNVDDVVIRRDAGTETIRGYYYANEVSHPLMSILDEAKDAKVDGAWDTERSGRWYPDSQNSANKCFNLHKGYVNPEIEVVVTTGILKIGVGKNGGVANDWIVVDNFKLTYLGNNIDLTTYLEALQTAIDNGNAFDTSSTSSVLAQALAAAISDGQSALSSTDPDEISAATAAITNAISAAKAVDLKVLNATIALAKQEGIDTSAAETIASQATSAAEINDALFDLRAARKIKAQSMPDIYTGSEPANGEKVYIYNLGTGMFLGTGASYNTHCAVDQVGIEIELIANGDGFELKTNRGGGWLNKGNRETTTYVDCPQHVWHFIAVSDGVYNISFDGTANNLLGYNPRSVNDNGEIYWSSIGIMREDGSDLMNQWKIVTVAEREALIATAAKNNPIDVSNLIKSASMNAQDNRDADWQKEVSGGNGGAWVNNFENHGYEVYNADNFKIHQTIEGLQPGLYEVSVQGFWREGNGGNQANIVNQGGTLNQKAYLYANDAQALLSNIASCPDFVPGIASQASDKGNFPNWPAEALEFFETGAFKTTVTAIVGDDGILTIGVGVDERVEDGDWVVMDNFRLTYLGNGDDLNYDRALASVEDGSAYRIKTDVEGTTYYVKVDGTLTAETNDAGVFKFSKVSGGAAYGYGFHIDGGGTRFTNPNGTNDAALTLGKITTTTGSRVDWEAQVLFKNADGKYAVRATNAGGGDSGWGYVAKTFWTVNEGPLAEYGFDQKYIWELEYAYDAAGVAEHEAAAKLMENWLPTIMAAKGPSTYISNAKDPSEGSYEALLDGDYSTFFHSTWHASNDPQADHYLQAELPEASQEFYFYFKKRQQNNNNRPTTIVVSGSNDGENFTEITTINEGLPTAESVIDYTSAKITGNEAYKYLRFTVPTTNSGNKTGDHVFFTFSEFYIYPADIPEAAAALGIVTEATPTYMLDAANVQAVDAALKAALSTVKVTYALVEAGGTTVQEKTVVQEANSEVNVPADFTNKPYYDYVVEGTIGDTDCTITITRSYKAGLVTALSDLSNAKAYTIVCDRGALLTKDSYLASTAHNTLTDAEPADFAIIYYDETDDETDNGYYYLYSVADGKFVRNNGSLDDMPTNGIEDAIVMTPKTNPYFLYNFNTTNAYLNTNGNDPYGYVINSYSTPDAGNQYYMIATADFDPTAAIAALDAYFNPTHFVTYVVKDAEGNTLFTSDAVPAIAGSTITTLPAEYQRAFTTYNEVEVPITEEQTTVEFTATSTFPFELSASFDEAKWYNMTIRSDYYVAKDETEPYYPKTDKDLDAPESQWAFAGDAYNGIVVMNKAAGEGWSLTKVENNVVMREGAYAWTIGANADGFTLREIGTDNNCVNQNGGSEGPLQFWNSAGSLTDNGSTFRVTEVPANMNELELTIDVERQPGIGYTATTFVPDFTEALEFLGIEDITEATTWVINADDTEVEATFGGGTPDGWFDGQGTLVGWGTESKICVKFNIADADYMVCDMNGADVVGTTYTVKYALKANGKAAIFTINVTFAEAAALLLEDYTQVGSFSFTITADPDVAFEAKESESLAESEVSALFSDDWSEIYGQGAVVDGKATLTKNYSCDPQPGFWCLEDGTADQWANSIFGVSLIPADDWSTFLFRAWTKNALPKDMTTTFYLTNDVTKEYVACIVTLKSNVGTPDGQDFAGAIEQTVYNRNTGEALPGATETGEQTVSIAPAEDGKVNITFSGFTMPGLNMEVPEFTVTATATTNEDGSISYSAEEFTVAMQRGQMTINYTGTLEGIQANAEAVPGLHLMLSQAAIDEVYFAADADAIEALKEIFEPVPVAIKGINADQLNGTIYDLGGRKIQKVQRGGVYIVNGKKVAVK